MTRRTTTIAIAAVAAVILAVLAAYVVVGGRLKAGTPGVGVAVAAQIGCADVFLMGRSVTDAERDDVHALAPAAKMIRLRADRERRTVTAIIPGLLSRTAAFRPGLGCTLASRPGATPEPGSSGGGRVAVVAAPLPQGPRSARLDAAVAAVFAATNSDGRPDTRAILVMQDGRVVAEQYAPGFSAATPFLGWSATKSVTSALVGVLVRDGRLQLDAPAPVPEWRAPGDPRGTVTLRQLLTMSSGLKFVEDYVPGSDSSQMLFHEPDMAAYAARQPLLHPPGTHWSYSSGTANILSRIVRQTVGDAPGGVDRFAREQLFAPLGIASMLIEPDESGTPVGSSYGYATARDWARFGGLYLDGGMAGGRRVLPLTWIDFTRAPTPAAPSQLYGAMFWLNRGPTGGPGARTYPRCPDDLYAAAGHNGSSWRSCRHARP